MTTQFEFRLIGADAPAGELDADHLVALVTSLQDVATAIGRGETDAEPIGRPPKRTKRVSRLTVGLWPGSTAVVVHRSRPDSTLDLDLADEHEFDERFASLIAAIAADERPDWVSDPLARAAGELTAALHKAAPEVEFTVDGQVRSRFRTTAARRQTWRVEPTADAQPTSFTGRLFAVDLKTRHFKVEDEVGNLVALPNVADVDQAGALLGGYVTVVGKPEYDGAGRLRRLHAAQLGAAGDLPAGLGVPDPVSLEEILASAPGVEPGAGIELTDEEFDSFMAAIHGE